MRQFKIFSLGVLVGALSLPSLARPGGDQTNLTAANTAFGFDLFRQVFQGQDSTNIFISPFSVSTVLQMIDNGAAGMTRQEMEHTLHTDVLSAGSVNPANNSLRRSLDSQTNVVLELANAIWYDRGITLKPAFVAVNREFFDAELGSVDFASPQSSRTINDWAAEKTHGKITDIVQWPFQAATRLVLANAIYFKGKWEIPFDKKDTKLDVFHLTSGAEKQVPMMWRRGQFEYQSGDGFQAVQLPYAGRRLCMDVFLPDTNSNLSELLARFSTALERNKMRTGFLEREGTFALPRFKIQFDVKLNNALESLGMKRAFHGGDFSAMSDAPLEISEVKQKSYIDVDEEGTEAAAVTVGIMRETAMQRPMKPFEMIADRPFFFIIEDTRTRSVLFMGVLCEPMNQGVGI